MRIWLVVAALFLSSCSYGSESLKSIVSDPHYAKYRGQLDDLEKRHLDGALSYSAYLEQKKQLDDTYAREVQERENIIHGP